MVRDGEGYVVSLFCSGFCGKWSSQIVTKLVFSMGESAILVIAEALMPLKALCNCQLTTKASQ